MRIFLSYLIKSTLVFFLASAAFASPAPAKPGTAPAAQGSILDQKAVHNAYNEGDFEKVTNLIEAYGKAHKTYSRADSIFIAKHLAVVYSANPQTREKGKYYMYRLLEMLPSAELVDMFVSDEIDRIFEKVRKEFVARQKGFGVDSTQISTPEKASTGSAANAERAAANPASHPAAATDGPSHEYLEASHPGGGTFWKRNGMWVAGGVGLAVAGTVAYFIATSDDAPAPKTITIPNESQASK
jgi:hypothetical protein